MVRKASQESRGLMRSMFAAPGRTVSEVFEDLGRAKRSVILAEDQDRREQAVRLALERTEGDGYWELYRLDRELFVATMNVEYDEPRRELIRGEGLVYFYVKLSGRLQFALPGHASPLVLEGPCLLGLLQAPAVDTIVEMAPRIRESSVTLYCRRNFIAALAHESGLGEGPVLKELLATPSRGLWYRQLPLTANLLYLAKSLLDSPYRKRMRLLNAGGKALELLCEVLQVLDTGSGGISTCASDRDLWRLDSARRILRTQFNPAPRMQDVARSIGMSESKLKRAFKARFGMTVFDYGLECRMRQALEFLRSKHMPVAQVAYEVGYRHPTSFTAAFRQFYGFLPKDARTEMH